MVLIVALIGVAGVAVGSLLNSWLINRRDREARRAEFLTRQLTEFYGPLLSLRMEIRARSELRVKIQHAANTKYMGDLLAAGPSGHDAVVDDYLPSLQTMIRDENETFEQILMPRYREMVTIFRDKMWLAEPETRSQFMALVEFVDVWDKVLKDALPRAIVPAIGHTEENLHLFYAQLEEMHDRLRAELSTKSLS